MYEQYTISTVISPISHERKIESVGFSVYPIYVDGFAGNCILRNLRKENRQFNERNRTESTIRQLETTGAGTTSEGQGFQEIRAFTQQDEYFNHPKRDFKKTDEALRIRREQHNDGTSHCCITYKGANDSHIGQSRRELETRVEDEHKMRQILLALGFRSAAEVKKRRKEYKKEDLTVCLDELDGLGNYIEVEIVLPENRLNVKSATENRLREFLSELSFIQPVIEPLTYLELVMGFRGGSAAENASPND